MVQLVPSQCSAREWTIEPVWLSSLQKPTAHTSSLEEAARAISSVVPVGTTLGAETSRHREPSQWSTRACHPWSASLKTPPAAHASSGPIPTTETRWADFGFGTSVSSTSDQRVPSQCSMSGPPPGSDPTAQALSAATAETDTSDARSSLPDFGLETHDHASPSQCSISVPPACPTAHTSSRATPSTDCRNPSRPWTGTVSSRLCSNVSMTGAATGAHSAPSHCRIRAWSIGDPGPRVANPEDPTAHASLGPIASTPASVSIPSSGESSGWGTTSSAPAQIGAVRVGSCSLPARSAQPANPMPAAATSRAVTIATGRRHRASGGTTPGSRTAMSGQRSGTRIPPASRNRWSRSVIVHLQELAEPAASLAQVHEHRRLRRADDPRHIPGRISGEVVQYHRRPLLGREPGERPHEVDRTRRHLVSADIDLRNDRALPPSLEFPGGDREGGPPHPRRRIRDRVTAPQRLGECFRDRVTRHVRVARVQEDRPLQLRTDLRVDPFELRRV